MVHQKINYVLILFLAVLLLAGCKKKSKEYTTVIWEVVNPVTSEPYTNMLVRLYEAKKKNNGIEYDLIYEGKTNNQGRAEYSFKANLAGKFWYEPENNEGSLGHNGFDYSVLKQPSPSAYNVEKDEENFIRYEIVPIANYYVHIKNVNCVDVNDVFVIRDRYTYTEWTGWSFDLEGCFSNVAGGYAEVPAGTRYFEWKVTRPSGVTTGVDTVILVPGQNTNLSIFY